MKNIIKAKKKYGQNFLKDLFILNKIIQSIPTNTNHIVEIGSGLGDLTDKLVKYKDVTAYEIDTDLISILRSKFAIQIYSKKLKLIHTDVLEVWNEQKTLYNGDYDLIANLPYYIATNIILRAYEDINCKNIIVMIQKEVALKFVSNTACKEFSSLSVLTKLFSSEAKILFDVPSQCFEPPPKVTSSVLFISKSKDIKVEDDFKKFLKISFSQPRKKLIKNLSVMLDKNTIISIINELNLNENIRPHEVSASLYSQMYIKVKNAKRNSKNKQ